MIPVSWALAGVLALPVSMPASAASEAAVQAEGSGRLVFEPGLRGTLSVVDAKGEEVAALALGRRVVVDLPAGRYTLRDAQGSDVQTVEVEADEARSVTLPASFADPAASPVATASSSEGTQTDSPVVVQGRLGSPSDAAAQEVELVRRRRWARWAAPLLSAVVPGGGQALNGQPGRGLAVFTGTVGLVLGTVAVWAARDPGAGATAGQSGDNPRQIVRLTGLAGLSSAAGLLYLGQIMDAHAQAVDRRPPRPRTGHVIALEVSRFTAVGFAPGQPAFDLYPDWSLAIMGQLVPRLTLGLSDAGVKYTRNRDMLTVQAGVRAAYRFYEGRRLWLAAGGGGLFQGTRARARTTANADAETDPEIERAFSAVPYVHFDARLFLLDRWSLGLMPRVSVPLLARRFRGGRTLPRYATTFELGANMGVYF
ncbi:MAG: hypothetical protein K0V04_06115 [Deltaproteobacteria bacterium]|nr:hypothetical protein [Deltaproteobacteria bacterium]